jgi:hypothetical protein
MVEATLHFLIEEVGQVEGVYPPATALAQDFIYRKAVGHGIDWVGILAFEASPIWIMAALADLSGAGRHLIRSISETLKEEGLLAGEAHFESVDQLLDGLESSAAQLTGVLNTPPLRVAELRAEWRELRKNLAKMPGLPSPAAIQRSWDQMRQEAAAQGKPVFELAALISIASVSVQVTGGIVFQTLLDHYSKVLQDIRKQGLGAWWFREFKPYLRAAAMQFSPRRLSLTQRILEWRRRAS